MMAIDPRKRHAGTEVAGSLPRELPVPWTG
jgi:hypothetical protein